METKLELPGPDDGATLPVAGLLTGSEGLRRVGVASVAEPSVRELDAWYFDTDRFDLLAARATARRRTGGPDAGWHVKLPPAPGSDGRTELHWPLDDPSGADRIPDAGSGAVPPPGMAAVLRGTARGRNLRPIARLRTRRTVHLLLDADGSTLVEVAEDEVAASAFDWDADTVTPVPGSQRPSRWRELEVELVAGTTQQLAATVAVLTGAGARPSPSVSKLRRALEAPVEPIKPGKKTKDGKTGKAARSGKDKVSDKSGARSGKDRSAVDRTPPDRIRDELVTTLRRYRDALVVADRAVRIALLDVEAGAHPGFPGHHHLTAVRDLLTAGRRCRGVALAFGPLLGGPTAPARAGGADLSATGAAIDAAIDAGIREVGRAGTALLRRQEALARVSRQLADEPEPYAGRARTLLDPELLAPEPDPTLLDPTLLDPTLLNPATLDAALMDPAPLDPARPVDRSSTADAVDPVAELTRALDDPALFTSFRAIDDLLVPRPDGGDARGPLTADDVVAGVAAVFAGLTDAVHAAGIDGHRPEATQPVAVQRLADAAAVVRAALEAVVEPLGDDAAVLAAGVEEIEESAEEYLATRRTGVLLAELALRPAADGAAGFVLGRLHAFEEAFALGAADDLRDAWHRVLDAALTARLAAAH
ncbi:CYTH domain-containing protein [Nakamurella leprariae]|uniref:CYTH domain-containing protein n=1 Tax=Nakamurella leprariae TaxID=2803911 RepID=A0A939C3V3_9ACTN|nr:CYTH domain-containing protein [Nakamurella leprariae]MBM9469452.1 CYTH domain-containing protein [Nakamurella leprariae]